MLSKIHDMLNTGIYITNLGPPFTSYDFVSRAENWHSPLQRHPFFEFKLVFDGEATIAINEKEYILSRGSVCITPPEVPHIVESKRGYTRICFGLDSTPPDDTMVRILNSSIKVSLVAAMPHLLEYFPEEDYIYTQTMLERKKLLNHLEYMLLCCVDSAKKQDNNLVFRKKLINHFKYNLSKNLSLQDISDALFLSPSHIEHLVYEEYGCGVISLFHKLKIDHAQMLLHFSNLSIGEISIQLGYEDQSYFSRIFKKYTNLSPRDYQKQWKL